MGARSSAVRLGLAATPVICLVATAAAATTVTLSNASSDDVTSITLTSAPTHSSTGDLLWAASAGAASVDFGTSLSAASGADTAAYAAAVFHPNGRQNNVTGAAVSTTPEPSTALLMALGLGMLTRVARRRH